MIGINFRTASCSKWSFYKDIVTRCELLNKSGTSLFCKMHSRSHTFLDRVMLRSVNL